MNWGGLTLYLSQFACGGYDKVVVVVMCACSVVSDLVTPWTVAHQAPLSMRLFQARIPEWVATSYSRGSSGPRDQTCISCVSCVGRQILYYCATWEASTIQEVSKPYR